MFKLNYRYDHNSARLIIEGLPDISLSQNSDNIGILSTWQLQLIGVTSILEGKREHLESLMSVVLLYARYSISGIRKEFGGPNSPVTIAPTDEGHLILLRSSKEGIKPLKISLDDASLADLIRCLDDLINDQRVKIKWNIPKYETLRYREKVERKPLINIVLTPILGLSSLLFVAFILSNIQTPEIFYKNESKNNVRNELINR
ncbi:DUF4335 domain-containing protein [Prochlorococcus sp. MIT 1307]|uniref:DUF4335 domain-containing protein n=1 Tax=Prochlorococcus sp. MIT 1307 TaxID=3096219 RepID=UPI002A764516|nr:DUF4335 domain-containing protein [Prochlorococcus sp. MIT 1307]